MDHEVNDRNQTPKINNMWFHLYEIKDQIKLTYGDRSQNIGYLSLEKKQELSGAMDTFCVFFGVAVSQVYTFPLYQKLYHALYQRLLCTE
jgi:hypothetical protein